MCHLKAAGTHVGGSRMNTSGERKLSNCSTRLAKCCSLRVLLIQIRSIGKPEELQKNLFSSKSLGMGGVWKVHGKKGFQAIDFFFSWQNL